MTDPRLQKWVEAVEQALAAARGTSGHGRKIVGTIVLADRDGRIADLRVQPPEVVVRLD